MIRGGCACNRKLSRNFRAIPICVTLATFEWWLFKKGDHHGRKLVSSTHISNLGSFVFEYFGGRKRMWFIWKSISQGKLARRNVETENDGWNLLLNDCEYGKV